jgi:hypothetical protein
MSSEKLTPKQRRLQTEIEEISAFVHMDHWNILEYPEETRTTHLELMRRKLILGEIIMKYTYVDEMLSVVICHYYFKRPHKELSFRELWRTKKFRTFSQHVLDDTYVLNKMKLVRAIGEIPPAIRSAIERINALRNAVAHSFFPENRRQYAMRKAIIYQGSDIYTKQGIEKFADDFRNVNEYLLKRAGWV